MRDVPAECIVEAGEDWMLVAPIPPHLEREAARISVASRATLNRIVGPPELRHEVLGERLRSDRICIALVNGEVAGFISYRVDGAGAVWPDPRRYRARFGAVSGTARYLLTEATLRRGRPGELYLEGFRVEPSARGRGIGTALLRWLCAEAVRRGQAGWRLEASAKSDAALRIYERVGATVVKTISLGPLGYVFDRHNIIVMKWTAPAIEEP